MVDNKFIVEQLKKFHKIIDDLENIEVKIDNDDKDLIFLSSLCRSFENFKDSIIYGKEGTITLDEIQMTMSSIYFSKIKHLKIDDKCEDLSVSKRGSEHGGMSKLKRFDKSKIKCFTY